MAPRDLPLEDHEIVDLDDWGVDPEEGRQSEATVYAAMPATARKAVHDSVGSTVSGQLAAALVREMIDTRKVTLAKVKETYGYAPKVISEITNCKLKDGPKLATLIALGDALGFDVDIRLVDRNAGTE